MKVEELRNRLGSKNLLMLLALVIGLLSSIAAYILHLLIHLCQQLAFSIPLLRGWHWGFLILPILGIALTTLFIRFVVKDKISHGITRVLQAISTKNSHIRRHNTWTSVVASSITIGFGGSVGAEAPIVLTGSAIGSQLGRLFGLDRKTLMLLVGCGAAAAIAGVFKAPIAGLVFTLEVLMIDLSMGSILPILIASVTATCFSYALVGGNNLFTFNAPEVWSIEQVPANILLGVFCGFVSLYFIRSMTFCESIFGKIKSAKRKLLLGGILLSVMIFFMPALYGEGYKALGELLTNKWQVSGIRWQDSLWYIALVMLCKPLATASTNGAGGVGGTFAPSLVVGGFAGALFAGVWTGLPLGNFVMLGMAGVMAGVMHAPLTGIFLIAELTGGYTLFMPLMIVSVVSVLTISLFERHSIYASRLARQGKLLTHHTDHSVLTLMNLESVVEQSYVSVQPDMLLGKLINQVANAQLGYYPVVDGAGKLLGEVDLNKSRHVLFRSELYSRFTVSQVMIPITQTVAKADPMESVMQKFDESNAEYLPVVDVDGVLVGCIKRSRVYSLYRKMVADYSSE